MKNQENKSNAELNKENEVLQGKIKELEKSEEQFRLIAENTSDNIAVTTFDLKAKYLYVSPSVKPVLGYDPKDLEGKSFFDFIHPEDKKLLLPLLKKYINLKIKKLLTGKESTISETIEFRFKNKVGDWHYMQSNINLVGKQLLSVARDITERKWIESKLKQNENMLRQIINTTPNCIYVKDRNGMYLIVNKKMAEMHSTTPEDIVGKYDYEIAQKWFKKVNYNKFRKAEQDVIDNKKTLFITGEPFVYKDGTERWFQTTKIPFELEGNQNCLLVISIDITEGKLAENLLQESEKQLQTLIDAIPGFVCFKDGDGCWLKANDASIRIFQLNDLDYRGKKDSELAKLISNLRGAFITCKESDAKAWNEGALIHAEESIADSDGSIRVFDVTKVPVFHPDGKKKGLVIIGYDITERKETEKDIKQKMNELEIFNDATVDRELLINELRKEINELLKKSGNEPKYKIAK
ncbi:MAG: PAS domain S-box protein [Bacteroidales bacterium]|nr:PAS domain S-box protein [Bacteroidales bacterium]